MTTAAASPHVKRSVERRIKAGQLNEVIHLGYAWLEALTDEYLVPSARPDHEPHLVQVAVATDAATCDCEAGLRGLHCSHVEMVRAWQGRITARIASADNQLTRESVYA